MVDTTFRYEHGELTTKVDVRAYRVVAIQKTAYKLAARCTVILGELTDHSALLTFTFPGAITESAAREIARLFFQELLDQELREQLGEETRPLRALLLAHAFSKTDLIQRD